MNIARMLHKKTKKEIFLSLLLKKVYDSAECITVPFAESNSAAK